MRDRCRAGYWWISGTSWEQSLQSGIRLSHTRSSFTGAVSSDFELFSRAVYPQDDGYTNVLGKADFLLHVISPGSLRFIAFFSNFSPNLEKIFFHDDASFLNFRCVIFSFAISVMCFCTSLSGAAWLGRGCWFLRWSWRGSSWFCTLSCSSWGVVAKFADLEQWRRRCHGAWRIPQPAVDFPRCFFFLGSLNRGKIYDYPNLQRLLLPPPFRHDKPSIQSCYYECVALFGV